MHKLVTTDNAFIDARLNYETEKSSWCVCMANFILRINVGNCHNQFYCNIIYMQTLGRL